MDEMALKAVVTGKVQGIGYRAWLRDMARDRDVRGWVRNESDGSVTTVLAGPPAAVEEIASALRGGPEGAEVEDVETESAEMPEGDDFRVQG